MQAWDVIVVGAGPAGCAAAYDLTTSGKSVLLLDRCKFPRPKACAGGVTIKAARALRYSITSVVVAAVCRIQVSKNLEHSVTLNGSKPVCLMTVREDLDAFCLSQTILAGAEFRRIGQIQEVRHSLRHTYRSWLDSVGTPIGVQQKLMRHADVRTTMQYGEAFTDDMAEAHGKGVQLAINGAQAERKES